MRSRRACLVAASVAASLGFGLVACQSVDHPPAAGQASGAGGSAGATIGGGIHVRPGGASGVTGSPPDGSVVCGGERIRAVVNPPNLYFLLDRSGSMSEPIDATGTSKYTAARRAIGRLLRSIGHRVAYGAAVFPALSNDTCDPGREVFATTPGDPSGSPGAGSGPLLTEFLRRLAAYEPRGPTPTAKSLGARRLTLEALGERTFLVLATDGAPNCGEGSSACASDRCLPDLEGAFYRTSDGSEHPCGGTVSCCDPKVFGDEALRQCVDVDGPTLELETLRDAGIPTFVVGMPGSEAYAAVLSQLAVAGGTARPGATAYYAIADEAALTDALFDIGTGVAIDCDVALESGPEEPGLVNLYFDGRLVPFDSVNGWQWSGAETVAIRGEACEELQSGEVLDLQIVYGCETVLR